MPARPSTLITLGELARRGAKLSLWCQMCGRHRVMHVALLIARLGRDMTLDQVAGRLTCSACGSHRIDTRPYRTGLGVVAGHGRQGGKPG